MNEFDVLRAAAGGMSAQRAALDLAARNVAASEADGATFARLVPRFSVSEPSADDPLDRNFDVLESGDAEDAGASDAVRYLGAKAEPGVEPDAIAEMVSVLDAQRAYEANASVFDAGKRLLERTIDVERL